MHTTKMSTKDKARQAVADFKGRFEPRMIIQRALVGDGANHVVASSCGKNWYYIRLLGRQSLLAVAYCRTFIPAYGMNVLVEQKSDARGKHYEIIGAADEQGWFTEQRNVPGGGSNAPAHHWAHEVGGADAISIGKGLLENLRAYPTSPASMKLFVAYDESIVFGDTAMAFPGDGTAGKETANFTQPTFGWRYDLLSVDDTLALNITQGTQEWTVDLLTKPSCPVEQIPICWVLLSSGDTSIIANRIYDARPLFSVGATQQSIDTLIDQHLHIFNEDHSFECDGTKYIFVSTQEFEPGTLQVFHNGHLLRCRSDVLGLEDWIEDADVAECESSDAFEMLVNAPAPGDSLTVQYLAILSVM